MHKCTFKASHRSQAATAAEVAGKAGGTSNAGARNVRSQAARCNCFTSGRPARHGQYKPLPPPVFSLIERGPDGYHSSLSHKGVSGTTISVCPLESVATYLCRLMLTTMRTSNLMTSSLYFIIQQAAMLAGAALVGANLKKAKIELGKATSSTEWYADEVQKLEASVAKASEPLPAADIYMLILIYICVPVCACQCLLCPCLSASVYLLIIYIYYVGHRPSSIFSN